MDSIYFNKIAGAILAALLIMIGLRTFIEILYPKGDQNLSKGAIVVAAVAPPVAAPKAAANGGGEAEQPAAVILASASADAGAAGAKKCGACHVWEKGAGAKVGPNLYGVVGRPIGKQEGFAYSAALAGKGGQWSFDELWGYLRNPKEWIPGNKMAFAGIQNPKERADVIAFLNKQNDSPLPLPQK